MIIKKSSVLMLSIFFYTGIQSSWDGAFYNREAKTIQHNVAAHVLNKYVFQGNEKVLDIGCRDGKTTADIAALVSRGIVYGFDPSESMIKFAQSQYGHHQNISFGIQKGENFDVDNDYDVVTIFFSLNWVNDVCAVLKNASGALKSGGSILLALSQVPDEYLIDESGKHDPVMKIATTSKWGAYLENFKLSWHEANPITIIKQLSDAGFVVRFASSERMQTVFENKNIFKKWYRALGHDFPIPDNLKDAFYEELTELYLTEHPQFKLNPDGSILWQPILLTIIAEKIFTS